jgi:hypothetical protein
MGAINYPKEIRNGYGGVVEQPVKYKYATRTGWQTIRRFVGPYKAMVQTIVSLQQAGYELDMDYQSPVNAHLTATIGFSNSGGVVQDNPVDSWELSSSRAEKDLLQADVPIINMLSLEDIGEIRAALQNPSQDNSLTGNAATIYGLMAQGFTALPAYAPLIRRTQTVSAGNAAIQAAVLGVNTLYLLSSINPPNTLNIDLSALGTSGKSGYSYGWLKDFPNARVAAYNKTTVTQEWVYGLYPTSIFGVPQ